MNSQLAALVLFGGMFVAIAGIVTFPRWFIQPVLRARVWTVLDDVDRNIRHGHIPRGHPGVTALRSHAYAVAKSADQIRIADVFFAYRHADLFMDNADPISLHDLQHEARKIAEGLRFRLSLLTPLVVASRSWSSILLSVALICRALAWKYGNRSKHNNPVDEERARAGFAVAEQAVGRLPNERDFMPV